MKRLWNRFKEYGVFVKNERNISYFRLLIGYLWTFIFYGFSIKDYFIYHIYDKSALGKREFISHRYMKRVFDKLNQDEESNKKMCDKSTYGELFGEFTARESFDIRNGFEGFSAFCAKCPKFIAKPIYGTCGMNVSLCEINENTDVKALYEKLLKDCCLCDEYVVQHPKMATLNPSSVNTLRIITIRTKNGVKIFGATLRVGGKGNVMDNIAQGGCIAAVDSETGIVSTLGNGDYPGAKEIYVTESGVILPGFEVPFFDEAKNMAIKAADVLPNIRYTGWDIAITEKGPVLIEGNYHGMISVMQLPNFVGQRRRMKEIMKEV